VCVNGEDRRGRNRKMCHLSSTYSSRLLLGLLFLGLLVLRTRADAGNEAPATVVQTKLGKIRGLVETRSWSGEKYFAFRGIRYANPPVQDLRFKVFKGADSETRLWVYDSLSELVCALILHVSIF